MREGDRRQMEATGTPTCAQPVDGRRDQRETSRVE